MKNRLLIVSFLILSACSSNQQNFPAQYTGQVAALTGIDTTGKTDNFVSLFQHLKDEGLAGRVQETYADPLYFNDTLVTLYNRDALNDYLQDTANNLQAIDFQLLNVVSQNDDYYVHWRMYTRFQVWGGTKDIVSFGISHLQFDDAGKITLHQDYWDSTQGFFQHLPVLGGAIVWIKESLHD